MLKDNLNEISVVSNKDANERALSLIPKIRDIKSNIKSSDTNVSPDIIDLLHQEGLFRYFQPRQWGGWELDFEAWFDIPEIISRADCSTGWIVANMASHHRTLAVFDERIQREIWDDNPNALIAAGNIYQQGSAKKVEDGIILTGLWNFCSGIEISDWSFFAFMLDDNGTKDWHQCILHKSEYEILNDWDTYGMKQTGSCSVKINELFVPEYKLQSFSVNRDGHTFKGVDLNKNLMYQIPTASIGGHGLAGCAIGGAQLCLDLLLEWIEKRSTSTSNMKMSDIPTIHNRLGEIASRIDAARLILRNDCIEVERQMHESGQISTNNKLKYKRNAAYAVKITLESVSIMQQVCGANGIYNGSPITSALMDVQACSSHIHFNQDMQFSQWGRNLLKNDFRSLTL